MGDHCHHHDDREDNYGEWCYHSRPIGDPGQHTERKDSRRRREDVEHSTYFGNK